MVQRLYDKPFFQNMDFFIVIFHFFRLKNLYDFRFSLRIWEYLFLSKHSNFDSKLSQEAIFLGPMALKNLFYCSLDFFAKLSTKKNPFTFNGREAKNIPTLLLECGMNKSKQSTSDVDKPYWIKTLMMLILLDSIYYQNY